jgi:hypothetical protein
VCLGTPRCKLCCTNGVLQRCCMPAHDRCDQSGVDALLWHDLHMQANLLQLLLHQQLVFCCLLLIGLRFLSCRHAVMELCLWRLLQHRGSS